MKYALAHAFALAVVLATAAALHEPAESPPRDEARVALSEPVRARVVKYGLAATDLAGLSPSHVVDFIEAKTGAPREEIVDRLRKIKGRLDRDPDSLVAERVGIIVANADAVRVRDAIVAGLCKPLADEGDAVALAACQSRQAPSTGMRLCRVSNGAFVAVGSRMALTAWRVADVRAALLALAPNPNMAIIRNDDGQAAWDAALASNVPPLRQCNEGE